jgi:aminoglycoside phosphotransferase
MKKVAQNEMDKALDWCTSLFGPVEMMSDHSKAHGDHESSTCRLSASIGYCYLKVHQTLSHWHNEVHAYEQWAGAFGDHAPRLLAVRDESPLALVVTELPGRVVEHMLLPRSQEQAIWQAAGAALITLHDLEMGNCFGPCFRDGSCAEAYSKNAEEYVSRRFKQQVDQATRGGYISEDELSTIQAVYELIPAFEGERPLPCHRDYCAANWLASQQGAWMGVIDFEFAYWDVRVADFSRDPEWSWIRRPDLVAAFFEGYDRSLTPAEEQQLLVAHTEYALSAILWGRDYAFYGFEQEGRESLAHIATLLR